MVAVVATRELGLGTMLQRFRAKAAQDEARRGNNSNRYTQWPLFGNCCYAWDSSVCRVLFFFFSLVQVLCFRFDVLIFSAR